MGYRNDQFYQFPAQLGRTKPNTASGDNPPFMYPGNNRHRMDVIRGNQIVKRGFIKSLLDDSDIFQNLTNDSGGKPPAYFGKRMFFQFNPSLITQNVSQTTGSLPLLQDPGQLTQPVIGDTNFSFEIMLDRQMEMNRKATPNPNDQFPTFEGPGGTNPIETSTDATDIGVFADLKVLYSIIGQGLSAEQVEIYKSLLKRSTAQSSEDSETSASAATTTPAVETEPFDSLNTNIGNSAFLAPLPIRIVFSSLFMVDGFVTGTQVLFTKFNANMVPVQARVGLSVQAVYIGFARPKTVFNAALSSVEEQVSVDPSSPVGTTPIQRGDPEDVKKLREFESKLLKRFKVTVYGKGSANPSWDERASNTPSGTGGDEAKITEEILGNTGLAVYCGFPGVPLRTSDDLIYQELSGNNKFSIQYSFTLKVKREPVPNSDELADVDSDGLLTLMTLDIDSGMGENMASSVASTKEEWRVISRMKLRDSRAKNATYYSSSGGNPGSQLFMPSGNYKTYVNNGKKLTIEVNFKGMVTMGSPDKGNTSREYAAKYVNKVPIENSYLDVTFPIIDTSVGRERT